MNYLTPQMIADELGVARTTVDRLMQLDPEHSDFLEHIEWGRYRSGAKKRRVHPQTWEDWKQRHTVTAKPGSRARFNPAPKTDGNLTVVLQKNSRGERSIAN